jgi:Skp family chaperone for outer membrane proteins
MSKRFLSWPTSLASALVALGAVTTVVVAQNNPQRPGTPDNAPAAGKAMKVGVVDIGLLFRDYKRKDVLEGRVNAERERVKNALEADADNVRRMRVQLDKAFVPNSEPWLLLRDEIKQAQFVLELKTEREQNALKKRVEEFTLQILTELETTIRTYGERHRFDLILKSDREEQTPEGQQSELVQQFQERIFRAQISDVLFFAPTVDITDNVKRLLNDDDNMKRMEQLEVERERRRAAAASAPPAAPGTTAPTPAGGAQTPQGQRGN